jgi:hypothetical protein
VQARRKQPMEIEVRVANHRGERAQPASQPASQPAWISGQRSVVKFYIVPLARELSIASRIPLFVISLQQLQLQLKTSASPEHVHACVWSEV